MILPLTSLFDCPLAALDLEATGLGPDARIVEVAVVHFALRGELPRVVLRIRVNPEMPIPSMATMITGITDADVAGCPTWAEVAPGVMAALEGRVVVAYNALADFGWLSAENVRVGVEAPVWPWLDALVPAKDIDIYERGKRLVDVCKRRGIAVDAHGAAGDAVATALVLPFLLDRWTDSDVSLGDYWAKQRRGALSQEVDFCKYLQNLGARGQRPDCPWHVLEGQRLPYWPPMPATPMAACKHCRAAVVFRISQAGDVTLESRDGGVHVCTPAEDRSVLRQADDGQGGDDDLPF